MKKKIDKAKMKESEQRAIEDNRQMMKDMMRKTPVNTNGIIGELILKEKYKFVNKALIAEIVQDVVDLIEKGEK